MKKIIFTGGGTAGHVTPNLALIDRLDPKEWEIHYIGTANSIEQQLVSSRKRVIYHSIAAGKLRRYFSLKNFTDPFRVLKGLSQAKKLVKSINPDVVFSKGGFVSVPVVMAAKKHCPVIVHESDYTPGLANRIASKYADYICVTFSDTEQYFDADKVTHTGSPIRDELFHGSARNALEFTGLSGKKPVLLVMGGSLGAQAINEVVRKSLPKLLNRCDVIHICGEGKLDTACEREGYKQYAYVSEQLPDLLALADMIVSRAGSNSIFEFLALKKPAMLIPLPASMSRGDQVLNARYFETRGYSARLDQEGLTSDKFLEVLEQVFRSRDAYIEKMEGERFANGTEPILKIIYEVTGK